MSLLLDVRPDPVPVAGPAGLILLAIVVLVLAGVLIVGLVLVLKRFGAAKKQSAPPQPNKPNHP